MAVADGDGQGVRDVVGSRGAGHPEERPDHVLDLLLRCVPVADDGLLDFAGGIFGEGEAPGDRREDRDAAPLRRGQSLRCLVADAALERSSR